MGDSMIYLQLFCFLIGPIPLSTLTISSSDSSQIVETQLGAYRGFVRESVTNKQVKIFYGIPYAEPPIGANRFKPPLPIKPRNSTIDCGEQAPACIQRVNRFVQLHPFLKYYLGLGLKKPNENCLFLNLFIPTNISAKLPVMVWLHSGGFSYGTANYPVSDGSTLATEENVIVVTLNYRLSSFGFLYLGIDDAPGNVGLMDQRMALEWVRDHISSFGGDPERMTLFGSSAGACSISHHFQLDTSRPLFKRAILQSGVAHMAGCFDTRKALLEAASILATNLECPFDENNYTATLNCFATKDSWDIAANEPVYSQEYRFFFKPVVDGKYIIEHPELRMRKGLNYTNFEVLIGNSQDEITVFLFAFFPLNFYFTDNFKFDERDIRYVLQEIYNLKNDSTIIDLITNLYSDVKKKDSSSRLLKLIIRAVTDSMFYCASYQFENALLKARNKVFKYRFRHRREITPGIQVPKWFGVYHTMEMGYVFGEPLDPTRTFDSASKWLSRRMMRYWANFAKTGDPNISPSDAPRFEEGELPFWKPLNSQDKNFLNLDIGSTSSGVFDDSKCVFWNEIFPEILSLEQPNKIPGRPIMIDLHPNKFYV